MNTPTEVLNAVAAYYGRSVEDIIGPRRWASLTRIRHVACYLLRSECEISLMETGRIMGGRHYTTTMYAVRQVKQRMSSVLVKQLATIREGLKPMEGLADDESYEHTTLQSR